MHPQGLRLSSRYARQSVAALNTVKVYCHVSRSTFFLRTTAAQIVQIKPRTANSPPDCHSLPLPFESSPNCIPAKRKSPRKTWTLSFWQGREDSNPRPTVLETGTLPTELHPYALVYYITYFLLLQAFF